MAQEIGVQSYTYRKFPVLAAVAEAKAAGCTALELWPGHLAPDASDADVASFQGQCRTHGVRVCGYGVCGLGGADAEKSLRFAKRLGCDYVSVDVRPGDRDKQDAAIRLAAELGLNLGIHNHGPGHHYSTLQDVASVLEGRPAVFGACIDTGHFLRSDVDPVEVITRLGARVHAVHLKDFVDAHREVLPGSGRLRMADTLAALRRIGFSTAYVLEYEADETNPTPAVREAVAAVAAGLGRA